MEFKDKVVLITGASSGIGAEAAKLFAKEGAIVIINYLKSENEAKKVLEEVKKDSDGMIIKCDVTKEQSAQQMIDEVLTTYSRIDILVNNAGGYFDGDEWNGSSAIWKDSLNLNIVSTLNVSKFVAQHFLKSQSGIIVNIGSRYANMGHYDTITYAAAKAAILNITQAYAQLLSPFGRANSVSPGATDAGYWKRAPKEELEAVTANSPHKRLIKPEEIAQTILFAASERSTMITGQDFLVDGGK